MSPEIVTPETTSSNSFRVDHRPEITSSEISNDVETYIYEFRLKAQKKSYDLSLTMQNGTWKLGDPHRNEPMTIKAQRAIMERRLHGDPTHREEAEFAGLLFLEKQLGEAELGDSVIWFSPPGREEEGYGDYGFGFTGIVTHSNEGQKTVNMVANRFEKPTLGGYREAFRLLTGSEFNTDSADDFLRMPLVVGSGLSKEYIGMVFESAFGFIYDEAEAGIIDQIYKTRIEHLALEYSLRYPKMTVAERVTAIHAMENIATEAKKYPEAGNTVFYNDIPRTLAEARNSYDYEPEKVAGSCPVTKSNNPFEVGGGISSLFKLPEDKFGSREVECPSCGAENIRPQNTLIKTCQHCGSNKISCA